MKHKAISTAIVTATLALGSVSASYADHKVYPGSECRRWNEGYDPATYLSWSRIYNPSSSRRLRLDCPVVKDRYSNIRASWIRVIDRNPTDRVCTRLVGYRQFGTGVLARNGPARCTSTAFNSPSTWTLYTGALGGTRTDMHYYFSVYNVPKRYAGRDSGVVTYFVDEYNGHD